MTTSVKLAKLTLSPINVRKRPDDLLVAVVKSALAQVPSLDPKAIEDAIIGCSFPEAEQGMNMARAAMVLAGLPHSVGGVTVNRFCASGLTALQMACDRIRVGEADVMIAGGAESMSMVPMGGNKVSINPEVFARDENVGIAYGMGLTAEKVAAQWKVSREAQDAFALASHQKALAAQAAGEFGDEITPIEIVERCRKSGQGVVTGEEAFELHTQEGFLIEMTEAMAARHNLSVDAKKFHKLLDQHREFL